MSKYLNNSLLWSHFVRRACSSYKIKLACWFKSDASKFCKQFYAKPVDGQIFSDHANLVVTHSWYTCMTWTHASITARSRGPHPTTFHAHFVRHNRGPRRSEKVSTVNFYCMSSYICQYQHSVAISTVKIHNRSCVRERSSRSPNWF